MNTPEFMPVLSSGAHDEPESGACIMEMVSYLSGEAWSDSPSCTHRALAQAARFVNDVLPDGHRHLLVPLIGRLLGTSKDVDNPSLSLWLAREALAAARTTEHLDESGRSKVMLTAIEAYLDGKTSISSVRTVRFTLGLLSLSTADALHAVYAAADAHGEVSTDIVGEGARHWPRGLLEATTGACDTVASAGEELASRRERIRATMSEARAVQLVQFLSDFIDEYDRLSGRVDTHVVTPVEMRSFVELVGAR